MKIAIMGIRGIPANYGGFETFAEELSTRLVKRGHEVTVYGRSNIIDYKDKYYKGVELVILPTISHKYFDTVAHTAVCVVHSLFRKFDVVLICNSANSVFSFVPRLTGKKVAVNVCLEALQMFGGLGYMRDLPMERYLRDAVGFLHAGGTADVYRIKLNRLLAEQHIGVIV